MSKRRKFWLKLCNMPTCPSKCIFFGLSLQSHVQHNITPSSKHDFQEYAYKTIFHPLFFKKGGTPPTQSPGMEYEPAKSGRGSDTRRSRTCRTTERVENPDCATKVPSSAAVRRESRAADSPKDRSSCKLAECDAI